MERLKSMKESLMACAQSQMGNLKEVDAEELGEVIDMIKDLEEAMYYCSITKAMEEKEDQQPSIAYYTEKHIYPYDNRDMDRDYGRMYYDDYTGHRGSNYNYSGANNYTGSREGNSNYENEGKNYFTEMPMHMRDFREGRSPMSRKMYMESKEMHKNKEEKMKELENYVQELTTDIVEMIEDASPEEKQLLEKKIMQLAQKVGNTK